MGLFDKFFKSEPKEFTFKPRNEQEAWIDILYSCANIDGSFSESESDSLIHLVIFKAMFKEHDLASYLRRAMETWHESGSKQIIDVCISFIADEYKPTVFALATEILLSDGIITIEEQEILEYLSKALGVNDEQSAKIIEVYLIKFKGNYLITD